MYTVIVKRKIIRNLQKLPLNVQQMFVRLRNDLETSGPVQTAWSNYSMLSEGNYHCHLGYHHVAY